MKKGSAAIVLCMSLAIAQLVGITQISKTPIANAATYEINDAEATEVKLGKTYKIKHKVGEKHWFKIVVPENIHNQDVYFDIEHSNYKDLFGENNATSIVFYDSDGNWLSNGLGSAGFGIGPREKGRVYYFTIGDSFIVSRDGTITISVYGDYKKQNFVDVTVKKGKNYFTVKTKKGSKVIVYGPEYLIKKKDSGFNKDVHKTYKATSGRVKVKLYCTSLPNDEVIRITVKKKGYATEETYITLKWKDFP